MIETSLLDAAVVLMNTMGLKPPGLGESISTSMMKCPTFERELHPQEKKGRCGLGSLEQGEVSMG